MAHQPTTSRIVRAIQRKGIGWAVRPGAVHTRTNGVQVTVLSVADGYQFKRYALERKFSWLFADQLEKYLRKRPDMHFTHPRNLSRHLLYALPALRAWTVYMPNSLALEPVHDPEQRRLVSGKRIDPLTRRLFRHGSDPVGVRTRTVAGAWLLSKYLAPSVKRVEWVSLAGGTGVTAMTMLDAAGVPRAAWRISVLDLDEPALEIFHDYGRARQLRRNQLNPVRGDVLDRGNDAALPTTQADVVEMMGIFEYLDDAQAADLLRHAHAIAKPGGVLLFANMRRSHPQLQLHKRGLGWPSVVPREIARVASIAQAAGLNVLSLKAYQPKDGVYNVYLYQKA